MKTWRVIESSRKGLVCECRRAGDGSKTAGLRGRADSYRMHGQCQGGRRWVQMVEASPRVFFGVGKLGVCEGSEPTGHSAHCLGGAHDCPPPLSLTNPAVTRCRGQTGSPPDRQLLCLCVLRHPCARNTFTHAALTIRYRCTVNIRQQKNCGL